ncbi:hypothetical protein San01_04710 [Streptomyces angustmyceticus]|uniref:Uncharacterized protein n=1 Tax=Streptomyces angustmyceticus TaxID=285578 RepID=A0A5J4L594_9ACTN|nr:hypothetical protein San01_04710 [Streptomyces angustmyceticus]
MVVASSLWQFTEGPAGQPGAIFPLAGEMTQAGHTQELLVAAERERGAAGAFVASAGCRGCPVIPGGRTTSYDTPPANAGRHPHAALSGRPNKPSMRMPLRLAMQLGIRTECQVGREATSPGPPAPTGMEARSPAATR